MVFLQDLFLPGGFELANYNNSRCNVKTATGNPFFLEVIANSSMTICLAGD